MTLFAAALGWLIYGALSGLGVPTLWALPVAALAGLAVPARGRRRRLLHAAAAVLVVTAGTVALGSARAGDSQTGIEHLAGQRVRLLAKVDAPPDPYPAYVVLQARAAAQERGGEWQPASGRVQLVMPATDDTAEGTTLELDGVVQSPAALGSEGYQSWLSRQGIAGEMAFPATRLVAAAAPSPLASAASRVRARVQRGLQATLPAPDAALAFSLVFGAKHALPYSMSADLKAAGLSHLSLVSAFNVLLLYGVLLAALAPVTGRSRAALIAAAIAIAYGAFAGSGASAVRGELLVLVLALATASGRPRDSLQLLVVSAALLTLGNTGLLFDPSFQLTFAGALGIGFLTRPLQLAVLRLAGRSEAEERLHPFAAVLLEGVCASVGAALVALPVEASVFHAAPLYEVPANALVNPLVPAATLLAAGAGLLGSVAPIAASPLAALLWLTLRGLALVAHVAATLPGARLSLPWSGSGFAAAWYTTLGAAALLLRLRAALPAAPRLLTSWSLPQLARDRLARRVPPQGLLGIAIGAVVAAAAVIVLTERTRTEANGTSVRWLVAGQPALLVHGRNGTRVLVAGSEEPARLATALQQAEGAGAFVDLLIFPRAPGDAAELNAMATTAAGVRAQAVMFPAQPFPLVDHALKGVDLVPVPAAARVGLGRDDALELLDPMQAGVGAGTGDAVVRLSIAGTVLVVPGGPTTAALLQLWDDPPTVDVVTLLRGLRASDRAQLAGLHPRVVVAETAFGEAASVADLAVGADAIDLSGIDSATLGMRGSVAALSFRARRGR